MTELRTKRDLYEQREAIINEINWVNPPELPRPPSRNYIRKQLQEIRKEATKKIHNAKEMRETHLEQRALFWAEDDNEAAAKILANIKHSEASQAMFYKFKQTRGKTKKGAITIGVPIDPTKIKGPHRTIFDPPSSHRSVNRPQHSPLQPGSRNTLHHA